MHSRLDYGNGVLVGIPAHLMRRLQSVLNAAARLILNLTCSDLITDALVSFHWLRVPERIQYKIAVLSYKVLHDTAPRYLGRVTRVADIPGRRLRRLTQFIRSFQLPTGEFLYLPLAVGCKSLVTLVPLSS